MARFLCRWMRDFLHRVDTWGQALWVWAWQGKAALLHISCRFVQHHPLLVLQGTLPCDVHLDQGLSRRGLGSDKSPAEGCWGQREGQGWRQGSGRGFPLCSWGISCATCRSAGEGSQRLCFAKGVDIWHSPGNNWLWSCPSLDFPAQGSALDHFLVYKRLLFCPSVQMQTYDRK